MCPLNTFEVKDLVKEYTKLFVYAILVTSTSLHGMISLIK